MEKHKNDIYRPKELDKNATFKPVMSVDEQHEFLYKKGYYTKNNGMKQYKGIIKLITDNSEPFATGDIIRDKHGDHLQIVPEGAIEHMNQARMLKKWDRVIPYFADLDVRIGDEITDFRTGEKSIANENTIRLYRSMYFKLLGKTSLVVKQYIMGKFIDDGYVTLAERHELHEESMPGHENDVTGYWFKIKCPCCNDFK